MFLVILVLLMFLNRTVLATEIHGGRAVPPHSRPYMVLLELQKHHLKYKYCGGFLISEDEVMTAAHCQAKGYTAILGLHNAKNQKEAQQIPVGKDCPSSKFVWGNVQHDVMILKLKFKATLNDKVQPIETACPPNDRMLTSCSVAGWGYTGAGLTGYMSGSLQEVNVTLLETDLCPCEPFFTSFSEAGPRSGDSGGPLVCEDGKAYGVFSALMELTSTTFLHTYAKICDDNNSFLDCII